MVVVVGADGGAGVIAVAGVRAVAVGRQARLLG